MRTSFGINGLIVVTSALLWYGSHRLHFAYLGFLSHAPGIDLIFIPSGVRLALLLLGGVWAAVGVALGSLLLAGHEFGIASPAGILVIAITSGFAPYAALRLTQRVFGISQHLGNLQAWHLPVLSLCVAAGSSFAHNLVFAGLGREAWRDLAANTLAMAMGDFVGSLLVVALALGAILLYRKASAP